MRWRGIFPAALTMFDRQGGLDEDATSAHLDRLIAAGAHGVVVGGTSGEFIGLTERERLRLVEVAVAAVAGRVPVIAGTGWFSTHETIALTRAAADAGADGAIVILPYYQKPTVAEIMEHFRAVGRASPIPVMVYNNPANSSAPPLEAAHLGELYADGYVHAVKSTFPTVHQVHEVRAVTDEGFRVFYGSFMAPLEGMAGGAHGWISGILNVATADAVDALERDAGVGPRRGTGGVGADPADQGAVHQAAAGPGQRPRDLPRDAAAARPGRRVLPRAAARSHARPGRASAGAPRADRRRRRRLTPMAGVSLLIHGGEVVDGTGSPGYRAAIAVADGRVRVLRGDVERRRGRPADRRVRARSSRLGSSTPTRTRRSSSSTSRRSRARCCRA